MTNNNPELDNELEYVLKSTYRLKIIQILSECNVEIPSKIARETNIHPNNVTTALRQLKKHEIVECINPEAYKGRLYRLTVKGELIYNKYKKEKG